MSGAEFLTELRDELVRAAVRQHRRRAARRRLAVASAVAVCLLAAVAVALTRPTSARADVRVEVQGGRVELTLVALEHDPAEIEAAARRAGLRVSVEAVAAGPSQVGRFVGEATTGARPPGLHLLGRDGRGAAGFSIPVGWPGTLRLLVGRPAVGDEPYVSFSDALAPGEPLACRPFVGRPAAEVAEALGPTSLTVTVEAVDGATAATFPLEVLRASDRAGWVVVGADATSRRSVVLRIRAGRPRSVGRAPC